MRSIEEVNTAGYSITHGLYQSLESEKINRISREPIDTSKQFESLEPERVHAASFDATKRVSPNISPKPRNFNRNLVRLYGYPEESDAEVISRLSHVASFV